MYYAKAKDGSYPAMPKGEKEPKPSPTPEEMNEERLKMAKKEVEDRRKEAGTGSLEIEADRIAKEIPKSPEPETKKKKK